MNRRNTPPPLRVRGAARSALLVLLAAALLGGIWWLMSRPDPGLEAAPAAPAAKGPMTEAERLAYVKAHVKLEGLTIQPDTKPDSDETVPGLLEVSGEVVNLGPREVDKVVVAIYPRDETGEVVSAFFDDVVKKGSGLAPNERRSFSFTIPDRGQGTAEGAYDQELR